MVLAKRPLAKSDNVGGLAQLGEHLLCKQKVGGSIPPSSTKGGSSSVVEHHVANVAVASSNLVSRSILMGRIPAVLYTVHETRVIGACGFKSRRPYQFTSLLFSGAVVGA